MHRRFWPFAAALAMFLNSPAGAFELAKLMPPPVTRGEDPWVAMPHRAKPIDLPFRLVLRTERSDAPVLAGPLHEGQSFGLGLAMTRKPAPDLTAWHVYVVVVDMAGTGTLLHPRGAVETRGPRLAPNAEQVALGPARAFTVSAPLGVDTYYWLATTHPVPDPGRAFDGGFRREGGALWVRAPLAAFLASNASGVWAMGQTTYESVAAD